MATPPRLVIPGQTFHITIQAVNRQFRFVPHRKVVESIRYIFWYCVSRYGMEVHDMTWMSNHAHICMTDVKGVLPKFMCQMNSLISRQLNALRGLTGTNIEKGYANIELADEESLIDTCAYTLANPCEAGLVSKATAWKGVSTHNHNYNEPFVVRRPTYGLWREKPTQSVPSEQTKSGSSKKRSTAKKPRRKPSKLPQTVRGVLRRPDVMRELSDQALREKIRDLTKVKQREAARKRRKKNKKVLGWKGVLKRRWNEHPWSRQKIFEKKPQVSTRSEATKALKLSLISAFRQEYKEAFRLFTDEGSNCAVFPEGTWKMRTVFKAKCKTRRNE